MESSGEGGGAAAEGGRGGDVGGGCQELGFTEIETFAEGLQGSELYHLVKEVIGFVLYMHQQIPSVLQHIENEFDNLKEEHKSLEESVAKPTELKASSRRLQNMRIREVKQGIKRLEKLMSALSSLLSSLQIMFDEIPYVHGLILVLGTSLVRPQHVYELSISNGAILSQNYFDGSKSKLGEVLSRKVIRALISKGAGGESYKGIMKLFLLVKAPATFNLPQHFLPKRDFRYQKKTIPFRLHIKCRMPDQFFNDFHCASEIARPTGLSDSFSGDLIWFQCRSIVKGLACRNPSEE